MSSEIKVDFGSLADMQSQVSSAGQKILTEIEDIKRTVNSTQSYWTGAAQEQFDTRYRQLEQGQMQVQDAINQFGALIGRANAAYGDAEKQIASMFQ